MPRVQELPPGRVGLPFRRRGNPLRLEDPANRRGTDPVAELEQLALDPLVSPAVILAVASRSISEVISALTGGRPVGFG
jgi:hypothetical protein